MPSPRETILTALHARLQPVAALVLRDEVLPERIPAAGLIILRDGQPLAPSRDDVIEADDELFFLVSGTGEDELRQLLGSATHSRAQQLPWAAEDPFEEEIPGEPSGPALQ